MSTSAQAQAYREAFKQEFDAFKKSQQMKQDVKHLRQGLFIMRKNVVGTVKRPTRASSSHSMSKTMPKKKTYQEDTVDDYYQSPSRQHEIIKPESSLTLPVIVKSPNAKRAVSAKVMVRIENQAPESATSSVTDFLEQKADQKPLKKEFSMHVIKTYSFDKEAREQQLREKEAQEALEREERRAANKILTHHGVSQSTALQVSRRAAFERKLSSQSVQNVEEMITDYEQELSEWKHRLHLMEQAELERLHKEQAYAEELASNNGKPKSYFQVPMLATRARSNSRRFRQLTAQQEADMRALAQEEDERKSNRAASRSGRFALGSSHEQLKQMIQKREAELQSLIKEHADTQELYKGKTNAIVAATITTDDSNDSQQEFTTLDNSTKNVTHVRRVRQKIIKVGSLEEVQLDLSAMKMRKRRSSRRNSRLAAGERSGCSCGSRSAKSGKKSRSSSGRRSSSSSRKGSGPKASPQTFSEQLVQYRKATENSSESEAEDTRDAEAPKIAILGEPASLEETKISRVGQANLLSIARTGNNQSASKTVRQSLSPLKMTAKYDDNLRKSHNLRGAVLKPDQIILSHKHTVAEPFKFSERERCSEKRADSVYKRNAEKYEAQLRSSLRMTQSQSRAEDRLANFKALAENKANVTATVVDYTKQTRRNNHAKLEPFALFCDRYGRRVPSANKSSRQSSESSAKKTTLGN